MHQINALRSVGNHTNIISMLAGCPSGELPQLSCTLSDLIVYDFTGGFFYLFRFVVHDNARVKKSHATCRCACVDMI